MYLGQCFDIAMVRRLNEGEEGCGGGSVVGTTEIFAVSLSPVHPIPDTTAQIPSVKRDASIK